MTPAVVNVAATLLAAIPGAASDTPMLSSMNVNAAGTVARGTLDMVEAGRLIPRRLPGLTPWACTHPGKVRRVSCGFGTASHVWSASVTYRAAGGRSHATVVVRLVAR